MDPSRVDSMGSTGAAQDAEEDVASAIDAGVPKQTQLPLGPTITPLAVPWLHHDSFPTVKKVCSESGLPQAKKTSVVRVLQELRRGRNRIDQQLAHLETQLLHVSDFLSGATPTLEIISGDPAAAGSDEVTVGAGDLSLDDQHISESAAASIGEKSAPIDPVATLVEEDLATDTLCTTVGLWRYLSVFQFFKTVTLEDMQEALLLEDPASAVATDANDSDDGDAVDDLSTLNGLSTHHSNGQGNAVATPTVHELLKLRLLAALVPQETNRENGHRECINPDIVPNDRKGDGDVDMIHDDEAPVVMNGHCDFVKAEPETINGDVTMSLVDDEQLIAESWQSSPRTLEQLRNIGLVEASTDEVLQNLRKRQDDEVSTEIRMLQSELVRQVRRNNEGKRTLRRALERLKPWLTHDDEYQQIETKFQKLWRRKRELQRKKKHKEKKLQRKEASYKSAFLMPPQPPIPS